MTKDTFFTKTFLDECEKQLQILEVEIASGSAFAHPLDLDASERAVRMVFYNRILYMLYQGGRISIDEYYNEYFLISY